MNGTTHRGALRRRMMLAGMGGVLAAPLVGRGAAAQGAPLRIGFIATLSGPSGYIGEDQRDAWNLALAEEGGRLGGAAVQTLFEDDALRPANAKSISDRMIADGVRLFTAINFSNVLAAVVPGVLEARGFYVSLNAGPPNFAGATATQLLLRLLPERRLPRGLRPGGERGRLPPHGGDGAELPGGARRHRRLPPHLRRRGAGRDLHPPRPVRLLGGAVAHPQARPDALYQFHPGGLGINLTKQYANAGLTRDVPMLQAVFAMDERCWPRPATRRGLYHHRIVVGRPRRPAQPGLRGRLPPRPQPHADDLRRAGLRHGAAAGSALRAAGGDIRRDNDFRAAMRRAGVPERAARASASARTSTPSRTTT
jgi:branched-chain amino acid transport system substrate-binding protein